jgi:hypothetical protein
VNKVLLASLTISTLFAAPAHADPVTGTRLEKRAPPGVALTKRDVAIASRETTRCLFERRQGAALSLLEAQSLAHAEAAQANLGGNLNCFNSIMANELVDTRLATFSLDVLRGGIAEAAIARRKADAQALAPLALQQKRYSRPWFDGTKRNAAVDEMAVCVGDIDPAGVLGILATEPESAKEAAAFQGLTPTLGKCLVAGARLQADRQALRAALADALYQRLSRPALSLDRPEAPSK